MEALGKTVLQRTYESALRSTSVDEIYVATDSEMIKEHVEGFGGKVLWTSTKPINGTERIIEAMHSFKPLQEAKAILGLQGDHPCTPPETIDAVIQSLLDHPESSIATAARPIENWEEFRAPQFVKCVLNKKGSALYFSRSPIPHHPAGAPLSALVHLGLYCYRPSFLQKLATLHPSPLQKSEDLEQLQFLEWGYPIQVAVVDKGGLSVDVPQDLVRLNEFLCQQL